MNSLFIRTINHSTYRYFYTNVESFTYDKEFLRIHYYNDTRTRKLVDVFPISVIEVFTISERKEVK